jgi:predicted enzyme related to lactoylglutathione lyase
MLGFKFLYHMEDMAWAELETHIKGVTVGVSGAEEPKVGPKCVLTFGVKDIEAARRFLEEKGVQLHGQIETVADVVKLTTFYDPGGNTLMFYESLPRAQNP